MKRKNGLTRGNVFCTAQFRPSPDGVPVGVFAGSTGRHGHDWLRSPWGDLWGSRPVIASDDAQNAGAPTMIRTWDPQIRNLS